ncbi:hypothetical protein [Streptomyces atratus]
MTPRAYRTIEPEPRIKRLALESGMHPEALRGWIRQAEAVAGERDPGLWADARRSARERGRSDPVDAESVARVALREPCSSGATRTKNRRNATVTSPPARATQ